MTSVIELLLETLADLSNREQKHFKQVLWSQSLVYEPYIKISRVVADMQDTVFLMVKTFGQQSLKKTKKVLSEIKRTDLVQRLSDSSSGPKSKTMKTKTYSTGSKHVIHEFMSYIISNSSF